MTSPATFVWAVVCALAGCSLHRSLASRPGAHLPTAELTPHDQESEGLGQVVQDDAATKCLERSERLDPAFPYHGSEHAKISADFAWACATKLELAESAPDLFAMMSCHDVGYNIAAEEQNYTVSPSLVGSVDDHCKPMAQAGPKLGNGHETKSIITAWELGLHSERAMYGISTTKLGPPGSDPLNSVKAALAVNPDISYKEDAVYQQIAEAADFAYMAEGYGDDIDKGGGFVCHLLACFIEFFSYGGVVKNIFGASGGQVGDVPMEWAAFMRMQVGFAYFVTTDKLHEAKAKSLFGVGSIKKAIDMCKGATEATEKKTCMETQRQAMMGKISQLLESWKIPATTEQQTLCGLVREVQPQCPEKHAGIKQMFSTVCSQECVDQMLK